MAAKLKRALNISLLNSTSVIIFGLLGLLFSLTFFSPQGLLICLLITLCGLLELQGRALLLSQNPRARSLLIWSQIALLLVITAYAAWQLAVVNPTDILNHLPISYQDMLQQRLAIDHTGLAFLIRRFCRMLYYSLICASFLYQGGLALYYSRVTSRD